MNDPSQWSTIRFYQETEPSNKSQNRLPHWQQDGATYFVTFRLADALPSELLKKWSEDRKVWLLQNPKPWDAVKELEYHRKFSGELDRHLDNCHGSCLLRDPANATILAESLRHFDRERYLLHAWAIMPNHVHLLFSMAQGATLEKAIAGWKRFSANQIQKRTGNTGGIWQKDYFDRLIRNEEHFKNVVRYIRRNPEKANLPVGDYLLYVAAWA